jgi:hypothetical protein
MATAAPAGSLTKNLADLYDASGRTAEARAMYLQMIELWADADPSVRPLEEVRQALNRIGK